MARLIFRDSQGREGTVELTPTEIVYVGRGLECAIRTDDGMVSRRHAQFRLENGRWVAEDLGSANGTHLNNVRIQKQAIGHADVIQCGSLVIRFVDEGGVHIVPQQVAVAGPPPAKKGGTMVLDRGDGAPPLPGPMPSPPGAAFGLPPPGAGGYAPPPGMSAPPPMAPSPMAPPGGNLPYGGPPSLPQPPPGGGSMFGGSRGGFGGSAAGAAAPYGGPPAMPQGGGSSPNLPYGGPPGMPQGGGPPAMPASSSPNLPYGGPPAVPAQPVPGGGNPSIFGRGGPVNAPPAPAAPRVDDAEKKVLVDLGLEYDPKKVEAEVKQLKAEVTKANASYEREVADGKRIRAESATLRDKIEELKAAVKDREEQASAHDRVADELRDELQQTRNEYNKLRSEMGQMADNMAARERQAARAQEDAVKIREDMEDLNRQLMELSRTKDEGWKKLNEQLTEIEHLREVINEQERMLEERRVGLISQEEVIKELRADKEKSFKTVAQLKAERDEAATMASRTSAQIVGLEEENRRLGRLLVEMQTDQSRGGSGQPDHMMRLTGDIRDLRVELKKVEADREQVGERYELAERDRQKLEGRLAQVEVELQEAVHAKLAAESARNVAQDALAKAEVARHKAAEEGLAAAKARDQAGTAGDDARRELDKLRRKVADLEKVQGTAPVAIDPAEVQRDKEGAARKIAELTGRAEQAERALKALEAAVDAAKTDAQKARAEAARAKASADAHAESIIDSVGTPAGSPELANKAREIYDAINDILSEMRNNMVLVQGELPHLRSDDGETIRAVTDAVDALVDSAETAKGALRGLRDLAENK